MSDITKDYSFGGWLREFRLKRNITLREMARLAEWDSGNYSKLEKSKLSPPDSREKIQKLAEPLGLSENELTLLLSLACTWHVSRVCEKFEETKDRT